MTSDSSLENLLLRWSALEPDRCESHENSVELLKTFPNPWIINFSAIRVEFRRYDEAALLTAVIDAIGDRNLRVKIENASDGWYATLTIASESLDDCLTPHHDKECAIALLKAYVTWLESRAP